MSKAEKTFAHWTRQRVSLRLIHTTNSMMSHAHATGIPKEQIWAFLVTGAVAWTQGEKWTEADMHELVSLIWAADREPDEPQGASA